ncbi:MAG: 5' nucleotidase, deoxy (Pyrimidine), cytosolic type C protein (NT5C) [candidate division WS2 bacterium ADurb.Bin280]|uniref:5' nucleotidase, deoxy (Pyrimidine), cytosolic type C protein (NT5C) n=1 Tax=candidate division WS2 bacterium ADurb.Bin280 TaxID=1852829 RepID=A0A1V5SCW4_9BACT|nr:MAG: 5' nucleotidase, deoxy (Pyrimidine), cytosolic type C protein (NT5C) [candidate division WS2 bacterium ADurb.Bin280]
MSKQIIAIDVDEVLSSLLPDIISYHNKKYKTNYVMDDFYTYDYWKVWGGTKNQAIAKVDEFTKRGGFANLQTIQGSQNAIQKLKSKYRLFVVSSRKSDLKGTTYEWLENKFPKCFEKALFGNHYDLKAGPSVSKSQLCRQIQADYFIDDLPHYAKECADMGIKTYLFGDYPWNKADVEGAVRVANLDDIVRILM